MLQLTKVIGHRGVAGYAPENTFAAMQKAHDLGISWVEFDVMLTQDGEAILMHDHTLDRTTNGNGFVADTNYADIISLTAGEWFHADFAAERVPTLAEILQFNHKLKLNINIEIKPTLGKEIETATKVVQLLHELWPCDTSPPLVSSFSIACLTTARQLDPDLWLGLAMRTWNTNWLDMAMSINAQSLHVNHKVLTPTRVETIKKTGRHVLAYTVNDPHIAARLYSWGVVSVFSDFPNRILAP